jgi:hypothetical protein
VAAAAGTPKSTSRETMSAKALTCRRERFRGDSQQE